MSSAPDGPPAIYLIKQLQTALRTTLDGAVSPTGLTAPELAVLRTLQNRPGLSGADLARAAFVKPQSMTPLLKSLEARGLVTRAPDPAGGRALPAALTHKGQAKADQAAAAVREVEERLLGGLSAEDRRWFRAMLQGCIAALREP